MDQFPSANDIRLRCQSCGASHASHLPIWRCPCGGLLDVEMETRFPWQVMQGRPPGLWRYREALPLAAGTVPVSLGEPQTPLLESFHPACRLFLKLDFLFSTGSFKDRGASVLMTKVKELGVTSVVEDSSGNAGAAVAAYAAAGNVQASIYVPAGTSAAKTRQILMYGAQLVQVPGTRAETTDAVWQAAQTTYYASHVWNPYFFEGTKTIAFEVWEQLGRQAPQWVITPVGHGTLLLGVAKGFLHLQQAGLIDHLPRIVGVQAGACAPLAAIVDQQLDHLPPWTAGPTQAEGIAISRPLRWRQIVNAVALTGGSIITVSEQAIERAWAACARRGVFMELTSATAVAAFEQLAARGDFAEQDIVVVPVTGAGFKSAEVRILAKT